MIKIIKLTKGNVIKTANDTWYQKENIIRVWFLKWEIALLFNFTHHDRIISPTFLAFSHIRPLGAAGALAVDICICFHDIESYIFAKLFPSLAV